MHNILDTILGGAAHSNNWWVPPTKTILTPAQAKAKARARARNKAARRSRKINRRRGGKRRG